MGIGRREFITAAVATVGAVSLDAQQEPKQMHGLIGTMTPVAGKRDALITILLEDISELPGCPSCVVAKDASEPDAIWITEVWDSKASHDASLSLPSVHNANAKGRSLIARFGNGVTTTPVGGHRLPHAVRPSLGCDQPPAAPLFSLSHGGNCNSTRAY